MRRLAHAAFCLGLSAASPAFARDLTAPELPAVHPTPVAAPYDTNADAQAEIDAAFAEAKRTQRLVLLDFGGNWCPDCRVLAGVMQMPEVAPWLASHFVTVKVDIGRFDRNMELAARYGVKISAVPAVLVLTPDGKLLDPDGAKSLGDARSMTPQASVDLIARWGSR